MQNICNRVCLENNPQITQILDFETKPRQKIDKPHKNQQFNTVKFACSFKEHKCSEWICKTVTSYMAGI